MTTSVKPAGKSPRRVFVVDDHPLIREGLAAQIATQPNLSLCGEAEDIARSRHRGHFAQERQRH
jgi:DNA-binding NarL/FixJ family response regulator